MRNAHCKTWSMVRKMKIVENEKHTLQARMWQETVRNVETRNTQYRTCIIARKRKKLQNETQTLYDLEYGQKQSKT